VSNEAITWALGQKVDRSSAKFILVAMANLANTDMTCFPSVQYLADATCQDRKTVVENMKRLRDSGHITDTGERKGGTGQVPVYRLNSTENGTVKQYRKRDSTEDVTVPKTDSNSPVIPYKESRFSLETVPKTGHVHHIDTSIDTKGKPQGKAAAFVLPNWIPVDAWQGYLEMRKKKNKVPTDRARDLVIKELDKLRAEGHDLEAALDNSTKNGWTDVYAPKTGRQSNAPPGASHLGQAGQATAAAAQRLIDKMRRENESAN
jgi:hypothetical protein